MTTKSLEKLWREYPESHLHCDVTMAGINTYSIVTSLINSEGDVVVTVTHSGSGDLNTLKEEAIGLLADELRKAIKS